jgi:transposase InsO family protein
MTVLYRIINCAAASTVTHAIDNTLIDREEARTDVFNYIEMFYNPKRCHGYNNRLSPVEFESRHFERMESVW